MSMIAAAVGEVERGEQGLAVGAHARSRGQDAVAVSGGKVCTAGAPARRRDRDHAVALGLARVAVELEDADHVALLAGDVAGDLLIRVRRVREAGDVGASGHPGDIAIPPLSPGIRIVWTILPTWDRRPDTDDADVVGAAARRQRPQESTIRGQRAAGGEVAELVSLPTGLSCRPVGWIWFFGPIRPPAR